MATSTRRKASLGGRSFETVELKVKALLNKLTMRRFDHLRSNHHMGEQIGKGEGRPDSDPGHQTRFQ